MRLFILIILILLTKMSCEASPKKKFCFLYKQLNNYFAFQDTIPNSEYSSVITIEEFDREIDECILLLRTKQLREITGSQHRQIILCFNSLRDVAGVKYDLFTSLLADKCYFEDILFVYPDWLPSRGLGYYFPELHVQLFGAGNSKYRYKITK